MGTLAIILLFIGYYQGQGQHIMGIKSGLKMTVEILPLLIFAFIVAGMVQVLLPQELLAKWVGAESGLRGIFIGIIQNRAKSGYRRFWIGKAETVAHTSGGGAGLQQSIWKTENKNKF